MEVAQLAKLLDRFNCLVTTYSILVRPSLDDTLLGYTLLLQPLDDACLLDSCLYYLLLPITFTFYQQHR